MRTPCILVIDDEELVRDVTAMMLEEHGWRVVVASHGRDALTIVQTEGKSVVAAVIDFSMPDLNGYETVMQLWNEHPNLAVVMTSGLAVIPEIENLRRSKLVSFLAKPFDDQQLDAAIRESLQNLNTRT